MTQLGPLCVTMWMRFFVCMLRIRVCWRRLALTRLRVFPRVHVNVSVCKTVWVRTWVCVPECGYLWVCVGIKLQLKGTGQRGRKVTSEYKKRQGKMKWKQGVEKKRIRKDGRKAAQNQDPKPPCCRRLHCLKTTTTTYYYHFHLVTHNVTITQYQH